ncbi:prominin-1 isoform X4 [Seriola lalandi dorsalis]|uniref:prominin-1 isoform X4 n=1 Tax=Seriola lalandi dorsalis TaxID=1841481 RepID=UPI000C6F67C8|nr:prominin-1 isoform X4 [Seriola lalandi dorsalis]XP_056228968.1 prominin 1 b isoform X2 [Seriola aureovittata]
MLWTRWLVLLLCWGATSGEQQADERDGAQAEVRAESRRQRSPPPVEPLDFGFVPAAVYGTHAYYEPGAVGILFHMVHAFLYVVQPNSFPKDLIVKVIQQNMGGIKIEEWRKPENIVLLLQWIYYEAGFLICGTIGIVFVVLTPIIGTCFCVCRCCENCGGEMHQRQRKNADCQRGFYTASLIATSIFIILGVLIAYAANHNISTQIKSTRRFINTNMRDLKTFANNTPAQIEYLTAQYTTAKNKVLSDLDNIGPLLGGRIHSQLEKEVVPSLDTALRMAGAKVENAIKAMRETKEALENVNSSLEVLQEGTGKLQASLSGERASLSNTLSDPACTNGAVSHTCNTIRSTLSQLGINADFSRLPDVSPALANVNTVLKTDLSNIVQKGYSSFNDTPKLVKEQTKNIVSGVKGMLDKIGTEISSFSKMFPVESSLANFTIFLNQGQKNIESFYPQVDQMDFYRWIGCVAVLCMVVLVLAFNILGLLCGTCGYDKQATPTTRGCLSNTGGNLLMAGVGFSFIFAWVLMGIVTTLFVVGGNVEKLMCEPLANRQLFKIIDTPFLVHPAKKNFLPGMLFQNPNIDLTLGSMYRDCYENNGLYHALQLETMFNINSFLNRTVYNKDLAKVFESVQVDLQDISLLEQDGRDSLINFANSGVGQIDYETYLAEVNKGVTLVDLLSFSTDLEAQADQLPRGALENALKGHASSIRQIHRDQVVPLEQAMSTLSQSIKQLQRTSSELPVKVTNILSAIDAAEYLITHNASHVVKQETKGYIQSLVGYFKQYTDWVKSSLTAEVAQCKPISNIVDSMEIVACSFIVDSVNTFWFGLGGCCVFLIPSIIFSIKLAKYYRRMDTEDVFEDLGNTGNHGEQVCDIHGNLSVVSSPYYDTLTRFPRASAPPSYSDW